MAIANTNSIAVELPCNDAKRLDVFCCGAFVEYGTYTSALGIPKTNQPSVIPSTKYPKSACEHARPTKIVMMKLVKLINAWSTSVNEA
jgi:hypothetical protein